MEGVRGAPHGGRGPAVGGFQRIGDEPEERIGGGPAGDVLRVASDEADGPAGLPGLSDSRRWRHGGHGTSLRASRR